MKYKNILPDPPVSDKQKENIKKWLVALRSGDYSQGKGLLEDIKSGKSMFCCLGVACNISSDDCERIESKLGVEYKFVKEICVGFPVPSWFNDKFGFSPSSDVVVDMFSGGSGYACPHE